LTPQFSSSVITKSIAVAAKERRFRTGVPLIFVTLTLLRVCSGDNVELTISVIVFTITVFKAGYSSRVISPSIEIVLGIAITTDAGAWVGC
jgi:hypothetical protein